VTAPTPANLDEERLDRAFALVERQVGSGRAGYAALAVGTSQGLVRAEAFGPEGALERTPRSAIASITKPITATAVMQLVEDGLLVLNEPIATYLPEFRPSAPSGARGDVEPVTAWHVLTHTSGLTDADDDFFERRRPSPQRMFARACRQRLAFAPGSRFAYASNSFYVLAELVTRLRGEPYADVVRGRILEPLGMIATTFDPGEPGPPPEPLVGSYGPPSWTADERLAAFVSMRMPGGGLWSVPEDVVRFGRAMLAGGSLDGRRVLGEPFVRLMTSLQTGGLVDSGAPSQPAAYGLGWGLPGLKRGAVRSARAFGHSGATGSVLVVDPVYDAVIVYLRNEWGARGLPTDEAVQAVYSALRAADGSRPGGSATAR
jgi:CubicO group peptidase (beta-lactamase class C family)